MGEHYAQHALCLIVLSHHFCILSSCSRLQMVYHLHRVPNFDELREMQLRQLWYVTRQLQRLQHFGKMTLVRCFNFNEGCSDTVGTVRLSCRAILLTVSFKGLLQSHANVKFIHHVVANNIKRLKNTLSTLFEDRRWGYLLCGF